MRYLLPIDRLVWNRNGEGKSEVTYICFLCGCRCLGKQTYSSSPRVWHVWAWRGKGNRGTMYQKHQVRNTSTALSTNWNFHLPCGLDMNILVPHPASLNHRVTLKKAERKLADREQCWSFFNPSVRGSVSGIGMHCTSPGCKTDDHFLTCCLAVPSPEYPTTRRPVKCDAGDCGDKHDYRNSPHNHLHWWCPSSINQTC